MAIHIQLKCPNGHRRAVGIAYAGGCVKCEHCEHMFRIPKYEPPKKTPAEVERTPAGDHVHDVTPKSRDDVDYWCGGSWWSRQLVGLALAAQVFAILEAFFGRWFDVALGTGISIVASVIAYLLAGGRHNPALHRDRPINLITCQGCGRNGPDYEKWFTADNWLGCRTLCKPCMVREGYYALYLRRRFASAGRWIVLATPIIWFVWGWPFAAGAFGVLLALKLLREVFAPIPSALQAFEL